MPDTASTIARCMGEAAKASAQAIGRCVDDAVAELQRAEAGAARNDQRQELAAAWRELQQQRQAWTGRLPQLLRTAFQATAAPAPIRTTEWGFAHSRPQALSLVDESEISRKIEATRLTQLLVAALDRPLSELDALMSTALGLEVVHPERNPLRPEVYAQALRQLIEEAKPEPAWSALWVRHLAQPLTKELAQLYRDQAERLADQNVQAAGYRVVGTPSRASSAPAPLAPIPVQHGPGASPQVMHAGPSSAGPGHQAPGARAGGSSTRPAPLNVQQFLRDAGGEQSHQAPAREYYANALAELREVQAAVVQESYDEEAVYRHAHLPAVDRPVRAVGTGSALPQEVWGKYSAPQARSLVRSRLKTEVREIGQAFSLEIVRSLVDLVAQDPRLLAPVREAIVGLEPSLLRLAMVAPRFFSDEQHPGRLLLERVAGRSFKYNDEFAPDFQAFFKPVALGFNLLNARAELQDGEPFRALLASLQATWEAEDASVADAERKIVAAVAFADRRQQEAHRIAADLRGRDDLAGVSDVVRDFLLGNWALVIAHARLTSERPEIDPGGYLAVVPELLWSVKRELALHEPARAFDLIPRVLLRLRAGLESLGQQPAESDALFRELEKLHRPVMKLRARHRQRDLAGPVAEAADSAPAVLRPKPDDLWMGNEELRKAGFEDTQPAPYVLAGAAQAGAGTSAALSENDAELMLGDLAVGCWVDLYARQQWRRARMVWAAEKGTLFMFVSTGGQPHSMTRRSLHRLLRERLLRPVAREGVVPRALERIAREDHQGSRTAE